jgi:hypothetical protein
VIRHVRINPAESPNHQVGRRFVDRQHVQHLQDVLNRRQSRLHVPAYRAERRMATLFAMAVAVSIAGAGGLGTRPGRRAVQQQIDRSTVFVP